MKLSLFLTIFLLLALWNPVFGRGADRIEAPSGCVYFELTCDGRTWGVTRRSSARTIASWFDDIVKYCHVTSHIDQLKQWIERCISPTQFARLKDMGIFGALCTWRNEILNRGYAGKWGQFIRDREAGHVRRGPISQRCIAAENNLDREIRRGAARATAAANKCMRDCGLDLYSDNSGIAERGYYEGSRCASRLIYMLCA